MRRTIGQKEEDIGIRMICGFRSVFVVSIHYMGGRNMDFCWMRGTLAGMTA